MKSYRVAKLDDVPGLDGPAEETLICLRDTVERQFDERILTSVAAAAVALWESLVQAERSLICFSMPSCSENATRCARPLCAERKDEPAEQR